MEVADLARVLPNETLEAGSLLFEQGDIDGDDYIVQQERVELSCIAGRAVQPGIFVEAGQIFGVYKTLFENKMRSFTCTVVQKSRITRIPEQVLNDRIAASDPFIISSDPFIISSDPFIIYCVRNGSNLGDRLVSDNSSS